MAWQMFGYWYAACYECGCLLMLTGPGQLPVCAECVRRKWLTYEQLVRTVRHTCTFMVGSSSAGTADFSAAVCIHCHKPFADEASR